MVVSRGTTDWTPATISERPLADILVHLLLVFVLVAILIRVCRVGVQPHHGPYPGRRTAMVLLQSRIPRQEYDHEQ
jgi:hypothetical protein